ncbi:hypothetical protein C6A37_11305, partial [Desulfobacteraceae bacterium SEEP-SAG9]
MLSPRPVVAEAGQRGAQLALSSNKRKIRKRSKSNLPKRKPKRPQRKRARLFIKKPEKAAEVAADNHAGCMTETIEHRKPSRAGSFKLPALVILSHSNGLKPVEFTCPSFVSR